MNRTPRRARVDWPGFLMALAGASLAVLAVTLYGPTDKGVRSIVAIFAGVFVADIVQSVRRWARRTPAPDDQDRAA